jgi:hypothetical protein
VLAVRRGRNKKRSPCPAFGQPFVKDITRYPHADTPSNQHINCDIPDFTIFPIQQGGTMSSDEWIQISRTIDFILKQPTGAAQAIKGEPEKPKRKQRKPKLELPVQQLRLF